MKMVSQSREAKLWTLATILTLKKSKRKTFRTRRYLISVCHHHHRHAQLKCK
jgi:hypothetical protein